MTKLITPDVRVKRGKPSREQKAENKVRMENGLYSEGEIRLRIAIEIYDPSEHRYMDLKGGGMVVRCRSKEAVECVVSGIGEAVEVLDQLRLGK
jgi:hypothetical protein